MLNAVLASLSREYRNRRMARFAAWTLAYGVALFLVRLLRGNIPGSLTFFFWVAFICSLAYYVVRFIALFRERVLWSLRRRLVTTYIFIAIVPILLILGLLYIGSGIINGQFGAFLVASRLQDHFDQLQQLSRVVAHEAHLNHYRTPDDLVEGVRRLYATELIQHAASYPDLQFTVRIGSLERAFRFDGQPLAKPVQLPAWLGSEEFAGIVLDGNQIALRAVDQRQTSVGPLAIILSQPFTPELLDLVGHGVGPVGVLLFQQQNPSTSAAKGGSGLLVKTGGATYVQSGTIRSGSLQLPAPANLLDFSVRGASALNPVLWGGVKEQSFGGPVLLYTASRIMTLNRQLFSSLGQFSEFYVVLFLVVAAVFLIIELIALVIGARLTRSMTTTVDRLHAATQRVKAGDFSHRIALPARDQLSSLGEAFDSMTASLERLLIESQERSRLESELEIAREVQTQLFPQRAPEIPGLRLYGVCKAARVVSGDYYDFLRLDENRVGLVLGDISGKGISAALLMAAIQSALHAQFYNGYCPPGLEGSGPASTAQVVARLNRQLYESTPREKYVTFFYGVYDSRSRRLTYTNAGHCPPVLFRRGRTERLLVGGTVVGLFEPLTYEQAEITLEPGDLLLAYTDGLVEPENSYEEEFGEDRLVEAVWRAANFSPEDVADEIYRSVSEWTGRPELQDDMTLLVGKAV